MWWAVLGQRLGQWSWERWRKMWGVMKMVSCLALQLVRALACGLEGVRLEKER